MKNKASDYLEYLKRTIAEQVHLRGIESFQDFSKQEQKVLLYDCRGLLSSMIKEENVNQYGLKQKEISHEI